MANEITVTAVLKVTNGNYSDAFSVSGLAVSQAAQGGVSGVASVGTAEEDLGVGDVATVGYLALRNLDATNYVTFGPNSAGAMVPFGKLKPGEVALVRLAPGMTLRWAANAAPVKVQYKLFED